MPVPTTVADLDPVAANNYPVGSESVGPNLDNYLRAHAAIIRQVSDSIAPAISTALPAGTIVMWSGTAGTIPAGWKLCDGTNGTPNLVNRFVLGANATSPVFGATGGAATVTLNANQMPVHNHPVSDPGHLHPVLDAGHNHPVNDPGHQHGLQVGATDTPLGGTANGDSVSSSTVLTNASLTGVYLTASLANVSVLTNFTGVSTQNAGSGQAHENMPPYFALCYIQKS